MSTTESQKLVAQRVEAVSFQSVEGVDVRPWLPDQSVDVTSWRFDGTMYGEPIASQEPIEQESAEPVDSGPSIEELQAELAKAQASAEAERATHADALSALQAGYGEAARRFEAGVASLDQRLSESAVSLAMLMAERLLAREATTDPTVLIDNLNRALDRVGPVEHLRIEAHAEDVERLREIAPALAQERTGRAIDIIVTPSERLTRGGLVISFDRGVIDASWGSQLGHLGEAVALAFDAERLEAEAESASGATEPVPGQPEGQPDGDSSEGEGA